MYSSMVQNSRLAHATWKTHFLTIVSRLTVARVPPQECECISHLKHLPAPCGGHRALVKVGDGLSKYKPWLSLCDMVGAIVMLWCCSNPAPLELCNGTKNYYGHYCYLMLLQRWLH